MPKYELLNQAHTEFLEQKKRINEESIQFANDIRNNIISYFECKPTQINFIPFKENGVGDLLFVQNAIGANKLNDNGFRQINIAFSLKSKKNQNNNTDKYISLMMEYKPIKENEYLVKTSDKTFNINKEDEKSVREFPSIFMTV